MTVRRTIYSSPHLLILRRDGVRSPAFYFEGKSRDRQRKAGPRISMGALLPHHWRSPKELRIWEDQAIAKLEAARDDRAGELSLSVEVIMTEAMGWIRKHAPSGEPNPSGNFPHNLPDLVDRAIAAGSPADLKALEKMLRSQASKVRRAYGLGKKIDER